MAFFLNNNTTNMFKAAKQLTNLSKDFTISMKKLEQAKTFAEVSEHYGRAVEACAEMEAVSEKNLLSAGIAAAEERVETLIKTSTAALLRLIETAEDKEEMKQKVLESSDIFAEEILESVQEAFK